MELPMCGRFVRTRLPRTLAELLRAEAMADPPPGFNIAPTQMIAAVRIEPGNDAVRIG